MRAKKQKGGQWKHGIDGKTDADEVRQRSEQLVSGAKYYLGYIRPWQWKGFASGVA